MARKQLGAAPSGSTDADTKGARDTAIATALAAADGTGLTDNGAGVLNVDADCRTMPIAFHVSGTVTTGVKVPKFIAPVAGTINSMRGVCQSGASATYRIKVNGSTNGTTSAATGTSVVTTSPSIAVAAGDYVQVEVVAAGTGVDLSVTAAMVVGS